MSTTHSVVTNHRVQLNHDFDWNNAKILNFEKNYYKRQIAEMIFIKSSKNNINKQTDTQNLNANYDKLFNTIFKT